MMINFYDRIDLLGKGKLLPVVLVKKSNSHRRRNKLNSLVVQIMTNNISYNENEKEGTSPIFVLQNTSLTNTSYIFIYMFSRLN